MFRKTASIFITAFLAMFLGSSRCSAADNFHFETRKWTENEGFARPALIGIGAVTATYFISQMEEGPVILAAFYGMGAVYMMNEWSKNDSEWTHLVLPMGLTALAILNVGLLRDHDHYSSHDVFNYNVIGGGLLASYALWTQDF